MTISTKGICKFVNSGERRERESMQEKLDLCWSNALQDINVFQAVEKN